MKNLLIVDDEKLVLSSLSEALRISNSKFKVVTAENGEEAERILKSTNVDLLITDLNMPGKNGYELIAEVFKNHSDIPVIVMTASNCDSDCRMLQALNVRNIISKPFQFEKVLEIIHGVLYRI
jgi:DNA-binding NarL/FixJ family response regulator